MFNSFNFSTFYYLLYRYINMVIRCIYIYTCGGWEEGTKGITIVSDDNEFKMYFIIQKRILGYQENLTKLKKINFINSNL